MCSWRVKSTAGRVEEGDVRAYVSSLEQGVYVKLTSTALKARVDVVLLVVKSMTYYASFVYST